MSFVCVVTVPPPGTATDGSPGFATLPLTLTGCAAAPSAGRFAGVHLEQAGRRVAVETTIGIGSALQAWRAVDAVLEL